MKTQQRLSLAVLLAGLLASVASAKADLWSFRLLGPPIAINVNSPGHESITMTGGGTFDPNDEGSVQAHGTYVLFNAGDHPQPPVAPGTWRATGFVSWTPDPTSGPGPLGGTLIIRIETVDVFGTTGTGTLVVMENGIGGLIIAGETYAPAFGNGVPTPTGPYYKFPEVDGGAVFRRGHGDEAEHGSNDSH